MNLNVPIELHNSFKDSTAAKGLDMTTVLLEFIEQYVAKKTPPKPKRRMHEARRHIYEGLHPQSAS